MKLEPFFSHGKWSFSIRAENEKDAAIIRAFMDQHTPDNVFWLHGHGRTCGMSDDFFSFGHLDKSKVAQTPVAPAEIDLQKQTVLKVAGIEWLMAVVNFEMGIDKCACLELRGLPKEFVK